MAALALILTEPADVAKLVAVKALADSEVSRVGFTVIDLGLLDKPAFIQASRCVCTVQVKDSCSKLGNKYPRAFDLNLRDFRSLRL